MKLRACSLLVMAAALSLAACGEATPAPGGKPTVVSTIFTYHDAARAIAGQHATAVLLLKPGQSPHDVDPSLDDKRTVTRAAIVVKNGLGLDDWVDKLASDNKHGTVLTIGKDAQLVKPNTLDLEDATKKKDDHKHDGHDHDHDHKHDYAAGDPHVWLDPRNQIRAAEKIRDALVKADPANREAYFANAEKYIADVKALDAEFEAAAKTFASREFIGLHSAYAYLAARYGLTQAAAVHDVPEAEASPAKIREVVQMMKDKNIKAVFTENALRAKAAELIMKETGAQRFVLQPIETYDKESDTYVSLMRQNLEQLKKALGTTAATQP